MTKYEKGIESDVARSVALNPFLVLGHRKVVNVIAEGIRQGLVDDEQRVVEEWHEHYPADHLQSSELVRVPRAQVVAEERTEHQREHQVVELDEEAQEVDVLERDGGTHLRADERGSATPEHRPVQDVGVLPLRLDQALLVQLRHDVDVPGPDALREVVVVGAQLLDLVLSEDTPVAQRPEPALELLGAVPPLQEDDHEGRARVPPDGREDLLVPRGHLGDEQAELAAGGPDVPDAARAQAPPPAHAEGGVEA